MTRRVRTRRWGLAKLAILVAVVPVLASCAPDDQGAPPQLGACDLALDITGNPGVEWVHQTLDQGFEELQNTLCRDRVVTANLITDYSKANTCPEPVINTNPGDSGNDKTNQRRRNEAWNGEVDKNGEVVSPGVRQSLDQLIECGLYGPDADLATAQKLEFEGSDVFSAIQVSGEALDGITEPRTLILLSDMRNTMDPLKVPAKGDVDDQIKKLQEDGVIPDLQGAKVIVVGPGTNNDLSPAKQAKLVKFWEAYFQAANAGSVDIRQTIN